MNMTSWAQVRDSLILPGRFLYLSRHERFYQDVLERLYAYILGVSHFIMARVPLIGRLFWYVPLPSVSGTLLSW
jgi:hypothetical protein